jgi:hypothetical protein
MNNPEYDCAKFFSPRGLLRRLRAMTHFSLSGLRVLTNERGDDLNDLFLLPARELRPLFKNLVHLAGRPSLASAFDLDLFTQQLSHREAQDPRGLPDKLN